MNDMRHYLNLLTETIVEEGFDPDKQTPTAKKTTKIFYRGMSDDTPTGQFIGAGAVVFLATDQNHAEKYGSKVYTCEVEVGKVADLTYGSDEKTKIVKMFAKTPKDQNKLSNQIDIGELWHNKQLEKKIFNQLFAWGYDTIKINDTHSETYNDDADFGTTYVVKSNGKNVFMES